uniref:CCHC-type domain-containing protein n=1 Tax=Leptobrachium leishanense TaxID=445787 RepID=A0A8C5QAE7_9ANUR
MANVRCYGCNQEGHYKQHCPNRPELTRPAGRPSPAARCCDAGAPWPEAPEEWWEQLHEADPVQAAADDNRRHHHQAVWINGRPAEGLRDSGATITLVRPHLVPPSDRLRSTVAVRVAGGKVLRLETARVHLDWGNGEKEVRVGLLRQLPAEVLLGNDLGELISAYSTDAATPVTTRQQSRRQDRGAPNGTQVRPPPPPSRPPKPPKPPKPPRPPKHSRPPRPSRQPKPQTLPNLPDRHHLPDLDGTRFFSLRLSSLPRGVPRRRCATRRKPTPPYRATGTELVRAWTVRGKTRWSGRMAAVLRLHREGGGQEEADSAEAAGGAAGTQAGASALGPRHPPCRSLRPE